MFTSTDTKFVKINISSSSTVFFMVSWNNSFFPNPQKYDICHILAVHETWWYCSKYFYVGVKLNQLVTLILMILGWFNILSASVALI